MKSRAPGWSPRVQRWLASAGRGERRFAEREPLRSFEEKLCASATGEPSAHGTDDWWLLFGCDPSNLRIGLKAAEQEFSRVADGPSIFAPNDPAAPPPKSSKRQRWPIFATDHIGIYALTDSGAVIEEPRSRKAGGNRLFAKDLSQWLERAVLREQTPYVDIRWTAPASAAPTETPHVQASGPDETWWDEPGFMARLAEGVVTVWFTSNQGADAFFATSRSPEGELWTANHYRVPVPGASKTGGAERKLEGQLDGFLSPKVVKELRKRGALFDPPADRPRVRSLATLLKKRKVTMNPAAAALDEKLAGLVLPDDEDYLSFGIYELLESDSEPWPPHARAPAAQGQPLVPFAVVDAGTRQTLWIDEAGTIYTYSDEEARFVKLASSVDQMFTRLLFA